MKSSKFKLSEYLPRVPNSSSDALPVQVFKERDRAFARDVVTILERSDIDALVRAALFQRLNLRFQSRQRRLVEEQIAGADQNPAPDEQHRDAVDHVDWHIDSCGNGRRIRRREGGGAQKLDDRVARARLRLSMPRCDRRARCDRGR